MFDQALEGGGAKSINFQELAADLAQITFDYPFRIPPYFALIIRAISVLEGIALTANPEFAIVDEAYPYISKRLLTDSSPRLREALRYMVYGRDNSFNAERIIDLLDAFEDFKVWVVEKCREACVLSIVVVRQTTLRCFICIFHICMFVRMFCLNYNHSCSLFSPSVYPHTNLKMHKCHTQSPFHTTSIWTRTVGSPGIYCPTQVSSESARGSMDDDDRPALAKTMAPLVARLAPTRSSGVANGGTPFPSPLPLPVPIGALSLPPALAWWREDGPVVSLLRSTNSVNTGESSGEAREALKFLFSPDGQFFREFLMDEVVKSIDALSREQLAALVATLGLSAVRVPLLLPGATQLVPLAPLMTAEDRQVVQNMSTILTWLLGDPSRIMARPDPALVADLLPYLPEVATGIVPDIASRLSSRIAARALREAMG